MEYMDPNMPEQTTTQTSFPNPSSKKPFIALVSFLVVLLLAGTFFYLYTQNKKGALINKKAEETKQAEATAVPALCNNQKTYMYVDEAVKEPEKVCRLDLTGQKLTVLPSSVSKLKNLRAIYLTSNYLSQFPPELFSLTNLEEINLSENLITSVPKDIQLLKQLHVLNLTGNNVESLPPEIGDLTNLTTLLLGSNNLQTVPSQITKPPLESLDLSANNFSVQEMEKIKSMFPNIRFFISAKTPSPTPIESNTHK